MSISQYKGFALSKFQIESIEGILNDENVILSTHTGNGKTLVADFAVNQCFQNGQKVIYTAPIKALSNQKYNQFKREYGEENVGLITGDMVINQDADILVMTTEILRNMMAEDPEKVKDIKFIILDEIHYINDEERGTVWEEIIILKNPNTRIIGLSATIPNIDELCGWIKQIHQEEVRKVFYPKRIVKQKHFYFDKKLGQVSFEEVLKNYQNYMEDYGYVPYRNTHIDFVKYAQTQGILPVLYFVFSRRQCEEKAAELAEVVDLLSGEEKEKLLKLYEQYEKQYPDLDKAKTWKTLKQIGLKGVGFHHAGLLPIIKQFMEMVFENRLCKVLYATETFAVGINYPVKTVCFDSLVKFDGKGFRTLTGSEYLQMAGRAGRRGIDSFGLVFALADYRALSEGELFDPAKVKSEPIKSQFALTYNTVLNLVNRYSEEEIQKIFASSLANYQYMSNIEKHKQKLMELEKAYREQEQNIKKDTKCKLEDMDQCPIFYKHFKCGKSKRQQCEKYLKELVKSKKRIVRKQQRIEKLVENRPEIRFSKDFNKRVQLLTELSYIDENRKLLPKGIVCTKLHVQEILVTELLFNGFFHEASEDVINGVMAGIVCENPKFENVAYSFGMDLTPIYDVVEKIQLKEMELGLEPSAFFTGEICGIMQHWSAGGDFFEITDAAGMPEGDFVSLCRRTVDLLRQLKNAVADDAALQKKLKACMGKIDRDIVKLGL